MDKKTKCLCIVAILIAVIALFIPESAMSYYDSINNHGLFRVYISSQQNDLVNGAQTKINFNRSTFDPFNEFNLTNSSYTVPISGYYHLSSSVRFAHTSPDKNYHAQFMINGGMYTRASLQSSMNGDMSISMSDYAYLNSGDVVYMVALSSDGTNTVDINGGNTASWFGMRLVSI